VWLRIAVLVRWSDGGEGGGRDPALSKAKAPRLPTTKPFPGIPIPPHSAQTLGTSYDLQVLIITLLAS
jgi:hypothetical protein